MVSFEIVKSVFVHSLIIKGQGDLIKGMKQSVTKKAAGFYRSNQSKRVRRLTLAASARREPLGEFETGDLCFLVEHGVLPERFFVRLTDCLEL